MKTLRKIWVLAAVVWLTSCLAMVVMTLVSSTFAPGFLATSYVWITLVLSATTFALYGYDKLRAAREKSRIPENSLHLLALFGGWPGGVLGQQYFRHKTLKIRFRIILTAIVVFHWIAAATWFWMTRAPDAAPPG